MILWLDFLEMGSIITENLIQFTLVEVLIFILVM